MSKVSLKMMLDNANLIDAAQIHGILTMMAEVIDEQQSQIEMLTKKIKRINAVFPSTHYGETQEMYNEDPEEYPARRETSNGL